jgi:CheY-like chemotaxis protein
MESGAHAVEYIKTHSPDLIMMDVEMPGINGFEATRKIRIIKGDDWFTLLSSTIKTCIIALLLYLLLFFETYHKKPYIFTFLVFLSPD